MDPDPTPFINDFKNVKKIFFSYFFLITYPQYIIFSLKNLIFYKILVLKFYFVKHYFSPLKTFMGKGKDPDPDPYFFLVNPDPDPDPEAQKLANPVTDPDPQHCFEEHAAQALLFGPSYGVSPQNRANQIRSGTLIPI
jgi:hypothetical protein